MAMKAGTADTDTPVCLDNDSIDQRTYLDTLETTLGITKSDSESDDIDENVCLAAGGLELIGLPSLTADASA